MRRWFFPALLALPCLAGESSPDLDVGVPAGSPLEWIDNIPTGEPNRYRGSIPRKATKDGDTVVVTTQPRKPEAANIFNYVKVITWDLPTHLKWYGVMPTKPDEKTIPTGGGLRITIEYPPQVPPDLFWLASATFLRKLLHPAELNDAESIQYLIFLGEPSLMAADAAKPHPGMTEYFDALTAAVSPMPTDPPSFEAGKGEYANMMIRLVFEDLVTDFPFSLEQRFCRRITQLGDDPIDYVIRAAGSGHSFLRRNAVYQLGRYPSGRATEELRRALSNYMEKDPVTRNRALEALAKRKDPAVVPDLIKRLKGAERTFKAYLIYALGVIGSPEAAKAVHEQFNAHSDLSDAEDFDVVSSSLTALGRMKCGDADSIVRSIEDFLKSIGTKNVADPQASLRVDTPSPANTRRDTLIQLASIALANSRPDKHADKVYGLIEASKKSASAPARGRARPQAGLLRAFHPMSVNVLIETLPSLEKGKDALKEIVADATEDEVVRSYALFKLATSTFEALDEFLKPYLDISTQPSPLVETALQAMTRSHRKEAVSAAKTIVDKFIGKSAEPAPGAPRRPRAPRIPPRPPVPGRAEEFTAHKRFIASLCLKLLGSLAEINAETLIAVIKKDLPRRIQQKAAEDAAKNPPQPPATPARRPGMDPTGGLWQAEFNAPDQLLESALIELGRLGDPSGLPVILEVLNNDKAPARAEACLALGGIGTPDAVDRLVAALNDADGWVRFMAYRTLKELSGADHFCDWIYESKEKRASKVKAWTEWAKTFRDSYKEE